MSVIFSEGFEHYGSSGNIPLNKYNATRYRDLNLATGRFFGHALRMGTLVSEGSYYSDTIRSRLLTSADNKTMYLGMAWKKRAASILNVSSIESAPTGYWFSLTNSDYTGQMNIYFNQYNENYMYVTSATGTTIGNFIIPNDASWHYIEVGCFIDSIAGFHKVFIDGVQVGNYIGNTGSGHVNSFRIDALWSSNNYSMDIDDIYVLDGSGNTNNTFLGDIVVEGLIPTSDGTETGWTPSTGSDHYALVDESPFNDSDNVGAREAGVIDTYNFSNLNYIDKNIKTVMIDLAVKNRGLYANEIKMVANIGGTSYDTIEGPAVPIGGTNYIVGQGFDKNPVTNEPWTISEVNNTEFGMKMES